MYGVMMAALLTAGTTAPDWGCFGRGCHGCSGAWSCHGCSGSFYATGNAFSFSGCYCSGCGGGWTSYGCGYYGCYGCTSWGCSGGVGYSGRWSSGCSCAGWGCSGCSGYVCSGCSCAGWGCSGCSGWYCSGCSGVVVCSGCAGYIVAPAMPAVGGAGAASGAEELKTKPKSEGGKSEKSGDAGKDKSKVSAPTTGRVTVRLPADAKLTVDGVVCPLTSATRTFDTPPLEPGRQYYYMLTAEVTRDGKVQSDTKRVIVEAGQESSVDFGDLKPVLSVSR